MPRDWSEERWIKVYLVDSASWVSLSWQARGLYVLLQRVADRTGSIDIGVTGVRSIGALLRASWDEIAPSFAELVASGYVVETDGALSLPEHIAQQEARSSDAARQRESRRKKRSHEASRNVTRRHAKSREVTTSHTPSQDVTIRGEESRREEKRAEQSREDARAREAAAAAAAPVDPKARRIALELAAHKKFASLDHPVVAEELLGSLGSLALGLVEERIPEAVAVAAAEAESGANERRLRQVLGWKLKDAASGKTSKKPTHAVGKDGVPLVQGTGPDHEGEIERLLERIERHNAEDEKKREEYRRANGLTEEVPF